MISIYISHRKKCYYNLFFFFIQMVIFLFIILFFIETDFFHAIYSVYGFPSSSSSQIPPTFLPTQIHTLPFPRSLSNRQLKQTEKEEPKRKEEKHRGRHIEKFHESITLEPIIDKPKPYMETKQSNCPSKNTIEFTLCWPSPAGHGACP